MAGEKRTRIACVSCREVKRKSKAETTPISPASKKTKTTPKPPVYSESTVQRSLTANSGFRFLRQLVKDIDPVDAPKVQLTAWNVGSRFPAGATLVSQAASITELISHDQMLALANVYYDKIDPCYSFVDRGHLFQHIQTRWITLQVPRSVDAMLCGVASCASYFSKIHAVAVEPQLVALAKSILDESNDSHMHDTNILVAWVCRVMYLRWTSEPQAAWLASCSAMHFLEIANLHQNHRDDAMTGHRTPSSNYSPQALRRLFGVAQHLNTWISYDLGVSRIFFQPLVTPSDSAPSGQYTDKLLALLPASLGLDPNEKQDDDALRSGLEGLVARRDTQPPLVMAITNVVLCILRRLSSFNNLRHSGDRTLDASLQFLSKSLVAARQMVQEDMPWHHLANVPFQTFCILLAIDTPASLKLLSEAMQTLLEVAAAYDTQTMRDAVNTAYLILSLHRKRRLEDIGLLDNVWGTSTAARSNSVSSADHLEDWPVPNETEVAWLHDLMAEIPSLQDVDLLGMMQTRTALH